MFALEHYLSTPDRRALRSAMLTLRTIGDALVLRLAGEFVEDHPEMAGPALPIGGEEECFDRLTEWLQVIKLDISAAVLLLASAGAQSLVTMEGGLSSGGSDDKIILAAARNVLEDSILAELQGRWTKPAVATAAAS